MEVLAMDRINKADHVQMRTGVDSRTGMVMFVETSEGMIDLRPYGAVCDSSMNYDGPDWDFD